MSRNIDHRDFTVNRLSAARATELGRMAVEASEAIPGEHRVTVGAFDPVTGNAEVVTSESGPAERLDPEPYRSDGIVDPSSAEGQLA